MKKIIAVDMDEVLSETYRALLKKKRGKIAGNKISWNESTSYNLREIPKINIGIRRSIWIYLWFLLGTGLRNRINRVSGAKKKLLELKKKGYELHVVTARYFLLKLSTKLWLYQNFRDIFDSVNYANFLTKFAVKKSEICKELGATIMIEDNLENAIDCANNGIKVYLFDKPWNQNYDKKKHKGIIKINSWDEIKI